jgi:hypothetical protein
MASISPEAITFTVGPERYEPVVSVLPCADIVRPYAPFVDAFYALPHLKTINHTQDHILRVLINAERIQEAFTAHGYSPDGEVIRSAALLHDIAAGLYDIHAATGAEFAEPLLLADDILYQHGAKRIQFPSFVTPRNRGERVLHLIARHADKTPLVLEDDPELVILRLADMFELPRMGTRVGDVALLFDRDRALAPLIEGLFVDAQMLLACTSGYSAHAVISTAIQLGQLSTGKGRHGPRKDHYVL